MKTVRTLADATRAALKVGAVVDIGGRRVNGAAQRTAVERPAPAEAAPVEAPEPLAELVAELREQRQAEAISRAAQFEQMQELVRALVEREPRQAATAPAAEPAPKPRQSMTLRVLKGQHDLASEIVTPRGRLLFERDRSGLVRSITAEPPDWSFSIHRDGDGQLAEVVMTPT